MGRKEGSPSKRGVKSFPVTPRIRWDVSYVLGVGGPQWVVRRARLGTVNWRTDMDSLAHYPIDDYDGAVSYARTKATVEARAAPQQPAPADRPADGDGDDGARGGAG
jgi:hypothetical protein